MMRKECEYQYLSETFVLYAFITKENNDWNGRYLWFLMLVGLLTGFREYTVNIAGVPSTTASLLRILDHTLLLLFSMDWQEA